MRSVASVAIIPQVAASSAGADSTTVPVSRSNVRAAASRTRRKAVCSSGSSWYNAHHDPTVVAQAPGCDVQRRSIRQNSAHPIDQSLRVCASAEDEIYSGRDARL